MAISSNGTSNHPSGKRGWGAFGSTICGIPTCLWGSQAVRRQNISRSRSATHRCNSPLTCTDTLCRLTGNNRQAGWKAS